MYFRPTDVYRTAYQDFRIRPSVTIIIITTDFSKRISEENATVRPVYKKINRDPQLNMSHGPTTQSRLDHNRLFMKNSIFFSYFSLSNNNRGVKKKKKRNEISTVNILLRSGEPPVVGIDIKVHVRVIYYIQSCF